MPLALRAFLTDLVDYAGLFPPARLDLAPALDNFARYRTGTDAWMLGRFIIPVARLVELEAHATRFADAPPWRFSVLGYAAEGEPLDAARRTLADARAFEARHAGRVAADRFEFKLPPALAAEPSALTDLFGAVGEGLREREATQAFFEVPLLEEGGRDAAEVIAEAAVAHNTQTGHAAVGVKLRCGGVTPDAFPSVEVLAHALIACRDAGAPFKATAGLHHPVRHYAAEVEATMHGFLNVFGGTILAEVHDLDRAALERILADEQPAHFAFDDEAFSWTDLQASAEAIAAARTRFATSYGSCSFDEPRDDLRALGMMASAVGTDA